MIAPQEVFLQQNLPKVEPVMYGIVNVSVANMRQWALFQSETVNQVVLGNTVSIFEFQNDFYYVENRDGYHGWLNKHILVTGSREMVAEWENSERIVCNQHYAMVREKPDHQSTVISDVVPCANLRLLEPVSGFAKVALPDGRVGYIENKNYISETEQKSLKVTPQKIATLVRQFLGLPYFWGGITPKGFDCSGLVQTTFRLLNVELPRNASQMANIGEEVDIKNGFDNLQIADLLFFGNTLKRITHVAIYLGDLLFIHAEGYVKINSLNQNDSQFNEMRYNTLLKARRVLV